MEMKEKSKDLKLPTAEIHRKLWMFFIEKLAFPKEHSLVRQK